MITVKVKFNNGDEIVTGINGNIKSATEYYMNNTFNMGVEDDIIVKAISVEEIL